MAQFARVNEPGASMHRALLATSGKDREMELLWLLIPVLLLIALDLAALRFGADSRPTYQARHNWW